MIADGALAVLMLRFEMGLMSFDDSLAFMQMLVTTGFAWYLPDHYSEYANVLLANGLIFYLN